MSFITNRFQLGGQYKEDDTPVEQNSTAASRRERRDENRNKNKKNNNNGPSLKGIRMDRISNYYKTGSFSTEPKPQTKTRTEKARTEKLSHTEDNVADDVALAQAMLDDFTEKYTTNKTDSTYLQSLIGEDLGKIAEVMFHYYDNAYQNIVESMNNVIKLMTAKAFALNLLTAIKNKDEVFRDWDYARQPIGYLIALALDTHHMKMITDTKSIYVEIISEHIFDFEIKDIQSRFHLSEDAAIDLIIGAPSFGTDMSDIDIRHQYSTILNMLINHGKSATDYMTAENQKNLFYYIFKDANRVAIKAVAQCLGDELIVFEEESDEALYNEYVKMLYDVLNEHDFDEIRFVLRYIVKVRADIKKAGKDTITTFDVKKAVEYENIKSALLDYVETSDSAKTFLAD